jgi:RNA polymerase sigma-70 factor (ECF subfamily)
MESLERTTDSTVFQAMVHPHVGRLLAYLERHIPARLRSLVDPQDIAQDTLFEAARSLDRVTFNEPNAVWRWIVTIARHRLINVIQAHETAKRGGRLPHLGPEEAEHGQVIGMLQELAAHMRTPSQSAAQRELLVLLERSIHQLQPAYRDAVRMRYVQGLSLKETADRLGRSEDAAQKLCVRGLAALRLDLRSFSLYV